MISHFIRELILPPGSLLILAAFAFLLLQKKPKAGKILLATLFLAIYVLSIPLTAISLTKTTQTAPPKTPKEIAKFAPQAIVVLGAGAYREAPEYGGTTVISSGTYQQLAYGAYLAKKLENPPILVTGGYGDAPEESEAYASAQALKEWGFTNILTETESKNTRENAVNSKKIAADNQIDRIALVTSASHAPRAGEEFRKVGFQVMVCPTDFRTRTSWEKGLLMITPTHSHFSESSYALRTHLARLWYKLRY